MGKPVLQEFNDSTWVRIFDGVVMREQLKDPTYFNLVKRISNADDLQEIGLDVTKKVILFNSPEYLVEEDIKHAIMDEPAYASKEYPYYVKVAKAVNGTLVTPHSRDSIYSKLRMQDVKSIRFVPKGEANRTYDGITPFGVIEVNTK